MIKYDIYTFHIFSHCLTPAKKYPTDNRTILIKDQYVERREREIEVPSVAINATFTLDNPTGLGVYTLELTKELLRMKSDISVTAYTSSVDLKQMHPEKVTLVNAQISPSFGFSGHLKRMLWQQSILPLMLKMQKMKQDILYSTVPEGIFFHRIKQIVTLHDILPIRSPESNHEHSFLSSGHRKVLKNREVAG